MKNVLLIGWDAADWDVINPLIDAGQMPNLKSLINDGVIGDLATLYPELSPMLWTSIATGKRAYKHGIYGFTEPRPDGQGIRPISNLSRKTKAIWNILSQNNIPGHVIGWWPSHPVEPIHGVMVSNLYPGPYTSIDDNQNWSLAPGSIHPDRIAHNLSMLRWHPQKLNTAHILPFVPNIEMIDQEKDHRLEIIANNICDSGSIKEAAVAVMHHEPWEFAAVYFVGIDHFSHGFMNFHPPLLPWVSKKDYEIYHNVINNAYIFHDILLGQLLQETNDDTTIILVSDHGFQSGELRPKNIPIEPAGPVVQHRQYGILVMKGPNIKADEIIYGPNLLDICPTILSLFDLPIGEDMDGKPLIDAFQKPPKLRTIQSWDNVKGDAKMHSPEQHLDPTLSVQIMDQLVDLGYIDKPHENNQQAIKETIREQNFNLAKAYIDTNMHLAAIELLEKMYKEWPDEFRFGLGLVNCYLAIDKISKARKTFDELVERKRQNVLKFKEELETIKKNNLGKDPQDISDSETRKIYQLQRKSSINLSVIEYLKGAISFAEKKYTIALNHLQRAENMGYINPNLYLQIGAIYQKMNRLHEAKSCYDRVLDFDSNNASAFLGKCQCAISENDNENAAKNALTAIGYQYFFPKAHYYLAMALHRLGRITSAIEALQTAIYQNSYFPAAYELLATIYTKNNPDHKKAEMYRKKAKKSQDHIEKIKHDTPPISLNSQDMPLLSTTSFFDFNERSYPPISKKELSETVIIVTGLPRSGTSMIMQMIQAGGISLMIDNKRSKDENNPKGYFEFEPTKQLPKDNKFLENAKGKGIKIIPQLLKYLNPNLSYRIIFIKRDLDEVIASQQKMLSQDNKKGANLSLYELKSAFNKQLKQIQDFLDTGIKLPTHYVSHRICIEKPFDIAESINDFLGGMLDVGKMAKVVSRELYRQRIT